MTQEVYILLPVHNRIEVTERFIDSLAMQTHSHFHLLLIDDGSTDGTAKMVQTKISNVTVIRGKGNWWWAGSLQQGINWLDQNKTKDSDIVLFANDDVTFNAGFLNQAVNMLSRMEKTLLLPQLVEPKTGLIQETGINANLKKCTFTKAHSAEEINCLPTRGLFMRMADLRRVGGFHPILLPHYFSDYEFTIRAHKKGLKLCTSSSLVINLDRTQTGYHQFKDTGLADFFRQYFTKKSAINPIYKTFFILLTSPWHLIPINVLMVWYKAFGFVFRRIEYSVKLLVKQILN